LAAAADSESWRVFIAIDLPEAIRASLRPVVDALAPLHDAVRPNAVDRIHLTLHFLGQLPVARIDAVKAALAPIAADQCRFALDAQGVGAFPNFSRAQVLWAGVAGADLPLLISLQAETAKALQAAGLEAEDRFHPHLTLARVRRPMRGALRHALKEWQQRWTDVRFGTLAVERVILFRSQLGAGPPRYSRIASFDLQ
jgi:RNA 2',3'-cyclic 3'-phosphodiesterase